VLDQYSATVSRAMDLLAAAQRDFDRLGIPDHRLVPERHPGRAAGHRRR
jgi:hypothetical protein